MKQYLLDWLTVHESIHGQLKSVVSTTIKSSRACVCCLEKKGDTCLIRQVNQRELHTRGLPIILEMPMCQLCFLSLAGRTALDRVNDAIAAVQDMPRLNKELIDTRTEVSRTLIELRDKLHRHLLH